MQRRVVAVSLIALAIVFSLFGTLRRDWFAATSGDSSVGVGLRSVRVCDEEGCRSIDLRNLEHRQAVTMSGNIAFFAALLGCALGALAAALNLAGVTVPGPVSPTRLAAGFFIAGTVASLVFLLAFPESDGVLKLGVAGPLAVAGTALGSVGTMLLASPHQPGAPAQTTAPPALGSVAMAPACPQCGAPTTHNPQHQRWYCAACRAYL